MLKIINLEHVGTLPGGVGEPHDRAIVIDTDRTEPNILSGKPQHVTIFHGTLRDAHAYVASVTKSNT